MAGRCSRCDAGAAAAGVLQAAHAFSRIFTVASAAAAGDGGGDIEGMRAKCAETFLIYSGGHGDGG